MEKSVSLEIIVIASLFILFVLTLTGGVDYYSPRSLKELWNWGHLLLFSILSFYLLHYNNWYSKKKLIHQILILLFLTALLSILIEGLQYYFAKGTPDINDMRRNFAGAFLGFVFSKTISEKFWRITLRSVAVLWLLFEFVPFAKVFADEWTAFAQFPVLADFENDLEFSRWSGDARFERSTEKAASKQNSMKIVFGTEKYSGVSLNHFPGDWRGYKALKFSVFYPEPDSLRFTCRIHDKEHIKGKQEYKDRFNRSFLINYGWNEIYIPLQDVQKAPNSRSMDMENIMGIGIFTVQLNEQRTVFIDNVRLE